VTIHKEAKWFLEDKLNSLVISHLELYKKFLTAAGQCSLLSSVQFSIAIYFSKYLACVMCQIVMSKQ
jgi:hypothetical protein